MVRADTNKKWCICIMGLLWNIQCSRICDFLNMGGGHVALSKWTMVWGFTLLSLKQCLWHTHCNQSPSPGRWVEIVLDHSLWHGAVFWSQLLSDWVDGAVNLRPPSSRVTLVVGQMVVPSKVSLQAGYSSEKGTNTVIYICLTSLTRAKPNNKMAFPA